MMYTSRRPDSLISISLKLHTNILTNCYSYISTILTGLLFFLLISGFKAEVNAQNSQNGYTSERSAVAVKVNPHPPKPDGILNEKIWEHAQFVSGFTQRFPDEGSPSKDSTFVAFVYDENFLYIGAKMYSSDEIVRTVTRRDDADNSERIIISMDTFNDNRTAYTFVVTASGVRIEYFHPSDRNFDRDFSYNPVWEADASITPYGWTAEMKIPFSQLRFNEKEKQIWGLNINRWIPARNEDSFWVYIPRDETGWSSRFGKLTGINGVKSNRPVEIIPYVASNAKLNSEINPDNPFDNKVENNPNIGGDVKFGIGSNLTLEATVNPDFGQVDADPAVVNLSAFEVFFPERRPFFTEGRQLLEGDGANFFNSRRIGTRPRGRVDGKFVDRPDNTTILGATKLTGRTEKGWSIGMLASLTGREHAETFNETAETATFEEVEVEPLTGYEVLRIQKEFGVSASTVGAMFTGVQRDVEPNSNLAKQFTKQAYTGNMDWNLRLQGGKYEFSGNLGFSRARGDKEVIAQLQRSSARFFQRPGINYVNYDTTRTRMTGYNAGLELEKNAGEHWLWEIGASAESPEFEINDIGLINTVDDINVRGRVNYRENEPGKLFRDYNVGLSARSQYNYGGMRTNTFTNIFWDFTFHNFWNFGGNTFQNYPSFSDNLTRGGPVAAEPFEIGGGLRIRTNNSKNTFFRVNVSGSTDEIGGWSYNVSSGVTARPGGSWRINLSPRYNRSENRRQYITTLSEGPEITFNNRFIFAAIERSTISMQTRVNYSMTPDFSVELYAEPFISTGDFKDFGQLPRPEALELERFGETPETSIVEKNGEFLVNDGDNSFTFDRNDFNALSFRSNLVLRWQWRPGSTLFVVWSQDRSEFIETGRLAKPSGLFNSLTSQGLNTFAIKFTYWLPVNV